MKRKILAAIAGSSAMGIGIGLHRSQFAVLGELMATNGWFSNSMIGILSGISLAGFVVGCIQQKQIKNDFLNIICIRSGLAIAVIAFFLEPLSAGLGWQVFWRLIAGWAAAQLVIGIPGLVTRRLPLHDHRFLVAWTIAGSGIAAFIASLLVSLLTSASVIGAWLITGIFSAVLAWPIHHFLSLSKRELQPTTTVVPDLTCSTSNPSAWQWSNPLKLLAASSFFFGAAQAAVVVYYPLLITAKFEISQALVQRSFSCLGLGYLLGAIAVGFLPHRYTTDALMTLSAFIGVAGVLLCVISPNLPSTSLGGFLFGLWNGSMISLLLDRINQSSEEQHTRVTWSRFSIILSLGFTISITCLSPIANNNVVTIIWIGLLLTFVHLSCQAVSRNLFSLRPV